MIEDDDPDPQDLGPYRRLAAAVLARVVDDHRSPTLPDLQRRLLRAAVDSPMTEFWCQVAGVDAGEFRRRLDDVAQAGVICGLSERTPGVLVAPPES